MSSVVRFVTVAALTACAAFASAYAQNTAPVTFPLAFEANQGQTNQQVRYLARSREGTLYFTDTAVTVSLPHVGSFRMLFDDTSVTPAITPEQPIAARSNYIYPQKGQEISGIENFGSLRYANVYPGIDVRFYGRERHLEHEFDIAPGANPAHIALRLDGIDSLRIAQNGDAEMQLGNAALRESGPIAWQKINGHRVPVTARWNVLDEHRLGITLGDYDRKYAVTVDPVLAYSTHLGGTTEDDLTLGTTEPATNSIESIVLDTNKNIYVAGHTTAANFPTTPGAFQTSPNSTQSGHEDGFTDSGFISKFDPTGQKLIYSTYLRDNVPMIAVDSAGHVYAAKGGFDFTHGPGDGSDPGARLDKLSVDGSKLLFSTTFGTTPGNAPPGCFVAFGGTIPRGIAVDSVGHVWMAGDTDNPCITMSANAFKKTMTASDTDGWVAKLDTTKAPSSALVFATYLGGSKVDAIQSIAIDSSANSYLVGGTSSTNFPHGHAFGTPNSAGTAGFVTKMNSTGSGLLFSTFIYGAGFLGNGKIMALDSAHNVYVAGQAGTGFPTTTGAFQRTAKGNGDGFVLKLNSAGSGLVFSTLLGGTGTEAVVGLAINSANMPFVTGSTNSADFPTTSNAFEPKYPAGAQAQAFVTALNANGQSLYYSTLLGGSKDTGGNTIFVDPSWNAWVGGFTEDVDYPITSNAFQKTMAGAGDGFIAKVVIASDLALRMTATATSVARGGTVTFTSTSTNNGPDGADSVVISNPIPAGFSYGGITFSNASSCSQPALGATSGTVTCTKTHLNKGAALQMSVKLKAIAASGSNLTNRATTSSKMQDLNKANNSATFTVHVN